MRKSVFGAVCACVSFMNLSRWSSRYGNLLLATALLATTGSVSAIVISDRGSLRSVDELTGAFTGVINTGAPSHDEFEFMSDGTALLGRSSVVYRFDPFTSQVLGQISTGMSFADMELTDTGELVVYNGSNQIRRFDPLTGQLLSSPISLQGSGYLDFEITAAGDLLMGRSGVVQKFNPLTGHLLNSISTGISFRDMELTGAGDLIVYDGSNRIRRFDPMSGALLPGAESLQAGGSFYDFEMTATGDLLMGRSGQLATYDLQTLALLDTSSIGMGLYDMEYVPIPAAVWLFGSGLLGLIGIARRKKT